MKVVVAPNAFKGSLSASEAASAIARGVRQAFPDAEVVEVRVADGGEGTVEALVSAHHGAYRTAEIEGPLGDPVAAPYGLIENGRTGVVELACARGLQLIRCWRRCAPRACSRSSPGSAALPPTTVALVWHRRSATGCSTQPVTTSPVVA